MPSLPQELIIEILLSLPVKSLLRFQSVSNSWRALINDSNFIELQLQRSIQTLSERILVLRSSDKYCLVNLSKEGQVDKPMKLIQFSSTPEWASTFENHCNGLFCGENFNGDIVIWNPSIRKHKKTLPVKLDAFDFYTRSSDIGYDPVNNDYKVVNIKKFQEPTAQSDVLVYGLKENSWRRVEDTWPFKKSISGPGTYLNGHMNWLVSTNEVPKNVSVLVTFDLTNEKFQVHLIPTMVLLKDSLRVLGGKLCACEAFEDLMEEYEVGTTWWVMEEYGLASNWSLLCTLPFFSQSPVMVSQDGQEILIEGDGKGEYFWYDRKKKTLKDVKILDILEDYCATSSQRSLLLINGDNDNKHSTIYF